MGAIMTRLRHLFFSPLPRGWDRRAQLWGNGVAVPLAILGFGLWRVWSTAASPFEELLGLTSVMSLALLWAMCFGLLAPLWTQHRE